MTINVYGQRVMKKVSVWREVFHWPTLWPCGPCWTRRSWRSSKEGSWVKDQNVSRKYVITIQIKLQSTSQHLCLPLQDVLFTRLGIISCVVPSIPELGTKLPGSPFSPLGPGLPYPTVIEMAEKLFLMSALLGKLPLLAFDVKLTCFTRRTTRPGRSWPASSWR